MLSFLVCGATVLLGVGVAVGTEPVGKGVGDDDGRVVGATLGVGSDAERCSGSAVTGAEERRSPVLRLGAIGGAGTLQPMGSRKTAMNREPSTRPPGK